MSAFKQAFALSKEEVQNASPPGTKILMGHELRPTQSGRQEEDHVQLRTVPTPCADPADPLNWPNWRKITVLMLVSIYSFVANFSSASLSSAFPEIITAFATFPTHGPPTGIVPFSDVTHLIAVNSLMLGAANIWWVPLSNTFGRRPIILLNLVILTACSIWCAEAKSFNSLLAARVFQGIGGAAADTLAPDCVGRLFFVHQRGRAMGIYTFCLATGALVGGLAGGYITASLGWRWTCWIPVILSGILLVFCLVLLPETLFDREAAMESCSGDPHSNDFEAPNGENGKVEPSSARVFAPYTFGRSLKIGIYRPGLARRFISPFETLRFPGTIMVMLHYSGLVASIVTVSSVAPVLLAAPPYLWGSGVGLINVGGLIGTILGALCIYLTADWYIKYKARRETHGFGEPETRLPLMFPGLILATAGSIAFGCSAQSGTKNSWVGMEFGLGMISFGLIQVPSIGFNYLIEAYGDWAPDCFLMVVVLRAIVSFAWAFFLGNWVESAGPAKPFGVFALLMGVFALTALPMWIHGKRMRIATTKWVKKDVIY